MKCPICGVNLSRKVYSSEHGIEEEYMHCKDGCNMYDYQFTYGNYLTTIGTIEVHSHYTDSKDVIVFHQKIINGAIEFEKKNILKE